MSAVDVGPRELTIRTAAMNEAGAVLVTACAIPGQASLPGTSGACLSRLIRPRLAGMGMGLSICSSIIEAHSGRLWACANERRYLSVHGAHASSWFTFRRPSIAAAQGIATLAPARVRYLTQRRHPNVRRGTRLMG
jgi:hypothetical protein